MLPPCVQDYLNHKKIEESLAKTQQYIRAKHVKVGRWLKLGKGVVSRANHGGLKWDVEAEAAAEPKAAHMEATQPQTHTPTSVANCTCTGSGGGAVCSRHGSHARVV